MPSSRRTWGLLRPISRGLIRRTVQRRWPEMVSRAGLMAGVILATGYVCSLSRQEASILYQVAPSSDDPDVGPVISDPMMTTLVRLAGSREVLDGAAADPTLDDLPWFREVVRVEPVTGLPLVRLVARGTPDDAPRIVTAVAASLDRVRNRVFERQQVETRVVATQRLHELRDRSQQLEHDWQTFATQGDRAGVGWDDSVLRLRDLARERVSVRVDLIDAEREATSPTPEPVDLARLQPVASSAVHLRQTGSFWVWVAAAPVVVGSLLLMLALSASTERRRLATEARDLRRQARDLPPQPGPLVVAIQLVHGDWRPRSHPAS